MSRDTELADAMRARAVAELRQIHRDTVRRAAGTDQATILAEKLVAWMSDQRHQGENLLHSVVCCDFASRVHFTQAIADIIRGDD